MSMIRPTKAAWVGIGLLCVFLLQPALVVLGYATRAIPLRIALAVTFPVVLVLNILLSFELFRPVWAVAFAILVLLAATYVGTFVAFNTYGA